MDEVRLINATPLEKEMQEYALYIGRETTNECESTAECCADMVSEAPTIDPETLRPTWRDPEKNLRRSKPKCWCWLTVGKDTASQRPFMRTELFLSTKASGSGKMSMITAFMTKKRTCIGSRKAGGNTATLPRMMHWNAR